MVSLVEHPLTFARQGMLDSGATTDVLLSMNGRKLVVGNLVKDVAFLECLVTGLTGLANMCSILGIAEKIGIQAIPALGGGGYNYSNL